MISDQIIFPLAKFCFFSAQFFYLLGEVLLSQKQVVLSFIAKLDNIFVSGDGLKQCFVFELVLLLHCFQLLLFCSQELLIADMLFVQFAFRPEGLVLTVHAVDYLFVGLVVKW